MDRKRGAPRRHKWLLGVVLAVLVASIWPGYLVAARIEPYVLGLPFSMAWLVGGILLVFIALLLTFRADMRAGRGGGR
ncbi:MAG TPA: hypothetical protein VHP13_03690 [Gammaproteobacteria bacterium]|jgi:hypothetical protein|nr:hypothetical protein [Gammaproteobacteria bacterium]